MKKTLLYRLFGIGKIPAQSSSAIQSEGVIISDEGVKGSTTYLNFRSPQRRSNWRKVWYTAAIALTNVRILGFHFSNPIIDVPFTDQRFKGLKFSLEDENTLLVAFDASLFHSDWSGNIEYRFKTEYAQELLDKLTQKQTAF
jgi:hypothetical protein